MKRLGFAGVLAGIAILLASTGLAADKGTMKVFEPTMVNGTQLAPGDYALQWEGTGDNVQLTILRGKKVVATTPASVVQLKTPTPENMTSVRKSENGKALSGINFRGKSYALTIGSDSTRTDVAKK
jgi:hypothetical protein